MGWIRRVHPCMKPDGANTGDTWQCDECGQRWTFAIFGWVKTNASWLHRRGES